MQIRGEEANRQALDLHLLAAGVNSSVASTSMTGTERAQKRPEHRENHGPIMVQQLFLKALKPLLGATRVA